MFTRHTQNTAPTASRPLMEQSLQAYGFVPTLHQVLAEAPAAYHAYITTLRIFSDETTLSPLEQQVVMMTSNIENRCHYCTAGHTMLMQMMKAPEDVIEALRERQTIPDAKLEALSAFARELLAKRGHVGDAALENFLSAGYDRQQALEVLVGLAAKLISNFTNALAHTELDEPVKPFAWTHPNDREKT